MSKVEELRERYPTIGELTFLKFVEGDKTPTKKYLEYMLKSWTTKKISSAPALATTLIKAVNNFDKLLPYIENKDIYSREYISYENLKDTIRKAEQAKEEKTFVKEEHVNVLYENDEYIVLQPLTMRGSLKYGSGTKWCTASKSYPTHFNQYTRNGLLVYVIRKVESSNKNYNKLALHMPMSDDLVNGKINMYNAADTSCTSNLILNNGWTDDDLLKIMFIFRNYFATWKKIKKTKEEVDSFMGTITGLDFEKFIKNLSKLEPSIESSYISRIKENLDVFVNTVKKANNAVRTT